VLELGFVCCFCGLVGFIGCELVLVEVLFVGGRVWVLVLLGCSRLWGVVCGVLCVWCFPLVVACWSGLSWRVPVCGVFGW